MIKVLHLFTTLDSGGVESFLFNYYSHIDRKKIQFDFIVPGKEQGFLEDKMKELGGKVYHVPLLREKPLHQFLSLARIIKKGDYDIVHCHGYKSAIGLILSKIIGCKIRIIHSHMAYVTENSFQKVLRKLVTILVKILATHWFACGEDSAKWLYGEKAYKDGKIEIIFNAIDLKKYQFLSDVREKGRRELDVSNKFVLGNIARLSDQKNQSYLFSILKELILIKPNVMLLLVGNGEDEQKLKQRALELNLTPYVLFLGRRTDISNLLSAMDVFLLPSKYEGLPVSLVEAQASGLQILSSDTVTQEVNVTKNISYLPINEESVLLWKDKVLSLTSEESNRFTINDSMTDGPYDICYQASKLLNRYQEMCVIKEI